VPEVGQGADDPVVAPGAILLCHTDDQRLQLLVDPKSECMRFVHSRGDLDSLRRSDSLDRCGNLWSLVELGQFIEPRSVLT
jgi:hypothetical protein